MPHMLTTSLGMMHIQIQGTTKCVAYITQELGKL